MRPLLPVLLALLAVAGAAQPAAWLPVEGGTDADLRGIALASPTEGLAVGSGNTILGTMDGGLTWTELEGGFFSDGWYDVELVGAQEAWVVGRNAIFQPLAGHSTDGGATWDYRAFYIRIGDVSYEGVARGVAVSGGAALVAATTWDGQGALIASTDGGATWATLQVLDDPLLAIEAAGATVLAVGGHGAIYRSTDGGASWAMVASGTSSDLYAVELLDGGRAVAVGDGAVAHSEDGGATWSAVTLPGAPKLRGVGFATPTMGYAAGLRGALLKTIDGGATWTPEVSATTADLLAVAATRSGVLARATAVGAGATVRTGIDLAV